MPAEAWEAVKGTIRQLYLEERKPLKDVIQVMADRHGFQATYVLIPPCLLGSPLTCCSPKMYKTRFSQWGFVKNNTEDEVKKLLSMKFQRDARGKVTEFVRNGRVINLSTYLKRKGVTEYELVNFEGGSLDLPTYVKCRTPTPPPVPGYLRSPELLRTQDGVVGNLRKAFLQCRQLAIDTRTVVGWSTVMVWGAGSSELLY
ncbi:Clr5 domain-containing protein, partial [Candidatus Bathyarchaeota archaeon]|nr:Clr5 domain-containing protein [Candidatus Bathyarchaeota archaeon]